ncbi:MAG: DUF1365 family protein [Granulosicoccus sp.]|jgi:DUF1365 family protein
MMRAFTEQKAKQQDSLCSAIYEGTVRHRRFSPRRHAFTYRVFMVYLDLQEIDAVFKQTPWWSHQKFSLSWFRRKDFFDGASTGDLYSAVASYVEKETGDRPNGAIRMLTNLRYFGFLINPITCYYCFDKTGETLETVVAEVTNTPWGQRRHYILPMQTDSAPDNMTSDVTGNDSSEMKSAPVLFDKTLHVSPFQPMDLVYSWRGKAPAENLSIHLDIFSSDSMTEEYTGDAKVSPVLDATLLLKRQPMIKAVMDQKITQYPLMTVKVFAAIYWQAVKLWLKKIPFHSAPEYKLAKDD